MALVTIDVLGMSEVVRGLERGIESLRHAQSGLRTTLQRFDVDSYRTVTMRAAVDWATDVLPGVRRRYAMAQALEGTNPSWTPGTAEVDESALSVVDPFLAITNGEKAAAALRDGDGEPDAALIAELRANMNDPYYASGFASELSPDELAALVLRLSGARAPADGYLDGEALAQRNAWYGQVVDAVSTTLGTATRATGELALPPGYAESWVEEITAEVPDAQFPDGTGQVDHANALGVLLSAGTFSLAFLGRVSEGVYDYERDFAENHRGDPWALRSSSPATPFVVYGADGQIVRDPMAGIMSALGKNAAAAQNFFSGGAEVTVTVGGTEMQVSDRLKYLLLDRDGPSTSDTSIGSAVEAATTQLRNQNGTGRISAELAAQTFALVGQDITSGGELPDGLRPSIAAVLASYGADVHRVVVSGSDDLATRGWSSLGSGSFFPPDMPYGASIDRDLLASVVGVLGEDQAVLTVLATGVTQAGNLAISTGLQRAMGNPSLEANAFALFAGQLDEANPAITRASVVLGSILDMAYEGAAADDAEKTERAEIIASAMNIAADLPLVPEIKSEWLKFSVDQAKDRAVDAVKGSSPATAEKEYEALQQEIRDRLTRAVADQLLQNEYLGSVQVTGSLRGGFDVVAQPVDGMTLPSDVDAYVISEDGRVIGFDQTSGAFQAWLGRSSLYSYLNDDVTGPFLDSMGVGK